MMEHMLGQPGCRTYRKGRLPLLRESGTADATGPLCLSALLEV